MQADGEIKRLVALLAQLGDGDILADLNAALEFNSHFPENIDLGIDNVFFKAEGRNTLGKHASGNGVFIKNGDGVAHIREEIRAAHARRACADDGDLLRVVDLVALVADLFGDIAMLRVYFARGDEFLYRVDGYRVVDRAARAGVFAALGDLIIVEIEHAAVPPALQKNRVAARTGERQPSNGRTPPARWWRPCGAPGRRSCRARCLCRSTGSGYPRGSCSSSSSCPSRVSRQAE